MGRYTYLGDRWTDDRLQGAAADPVRRDDGKCVVGRGSALVTIDGVPTIVNRRRLRLATPGSPLPLGNGDTDG